MDNNGGRDPRTYYLHLRRKALKWSNASDHRGGAHHVVVGTAMYIYIYIDYVDYNPEDG